MNALQSELSKGVAVEGRFCSQCQAAAATLDPYSLIVFHFLWPIMRDQDFGSLCLHASLEIFFLNFLRKFRTKALRVNRTHYYMILYGT